MLDARAQALIAKVNKALGDGMFVLASDLVVPKRFTSGSLSLDVILGGGFPGNQWSELIGPFSAGKTSILLKTIAANQALDPNFTTLWVAAEHYEPESAAACGVDNDRVIVAPTVDMDEAFSVILEALESKSVDLVALDSYPGLMAAQEDANAMDEATVAAGARQFGKFLRKAGKAGRRATDGSERPWCGVIVNQWRDKVGGFSRFGTPKTTPGGHAKDYVYYTRVDLARADWITEKRPGVKDPVKVGQEIVARTIKNKSAPPQQRCTVNFYFRGAPHLGFRRGDYDLGVDYVTVGILYHVIKKSGSWLTFSGQRWQGEPNMQQAVRGDITLREQLRKAVLEVAENPKALALLDEVSDE